MIKKTFEKIALGFRYAQTLLNLAFARFLGQFFSSSSCDFKKKQRQEQKQLGIRFAHKAFLLATLD
ncbi:hypothetical protein, partial [Acinetobacter pittii]|uniref:hypothetical protein n=2 Tax=Acinetobacter pittii TaxID=48296 RepID=UPI0030081E87